MTNIMTATGMPAFVVDRSPELMRGAHPMTDDLALLQAGYHGEELAALVTESVSGDGATCVVANALRRMLPGCEPHIEDENPYVRYLGKRIPVLLDPKLVEQIGRFDRGEPGAFGQGFMLKITV